MHGQQNINTVNKSKIPNSQIKLFELRRNYLSSYV